LEALCEQLTAASQFGLAIHFGLAAVAGEPLRESAHRVVIKAYLAEENHCEALRQYEVYRRLARTELDVEPSSSLKALVACLPGAVHHTRRAHDPRRSHRTTQP
jgi:DNA-binding SARP family transcriptional activator